MTDEGSQDEGEALEEEALDAAPVPLIVPAEAAGARIDRWIAETDPTLSRSRVKALLGEGAIRLNGVAAPSPSVKLKQGDAIEIDMPAPVPASPVPQALPLRVLFEDEHLIVLDKEAGMAVHPAPGTPDGTLVNALLAHCGEGLLGIGGVSRPGIVHRLDKGTSGVMVVAKTDAAYGGLQPQFADHTIERRYLAVCWRAPRMTSGAIDKPIGRSPYNRKKMAILAHGGRRAITHFRVAERFGAPAFASLLECRLETGRTHQIRVHLTSLGHPILGDPTYGRGHTSLVRTLQGDLALAISRLERPMLHAAKLGFRHPVGGQDLTFDAHAPGDFTSLLALLAPL